VKKIDILLKALVLIGWIITFRATGIYQFHSSGREVQLAFTIATATGVLFLLRYLFLTFPKEIMKDINALIIACWGVAAVFALLMALTNNWWSAILLWHIITSSTILLSQVRVLKYKQSTC